MIKRCIIQSGDGYLINFQECGCEMTSEFEEATQYDYSDAINAANKMNHSGFSAKLILGEVKHD